MGDFVCPAREHGAKNGVLISSRTRLDGVEQFREVRHFRRPILVRFLIASIMTDRQGIPDERRCPLERSGEARAQRARTHSALLRTAQIGDSRQIPEHEAGNPGHSDVSSAQGSLSLLGVPTVGIQQPPEQPPNDFGLSDFERPIQSKLFDLLVPGGGVEPPRPCDRRILSPILPPLRGVALLKIYD